MEQPATFEPATSEKTPFRLVCFTEYDMSRDMQALANKFQYLCYGNETCPSTGRQHFQGYAYAGKAQKWSYYKKVFGATHFEKCHGSLESNDNYCKKEGSWIEFGLKPMGNGKKRSLLDLKHRLDAGEHHMDIAEEDNCFHTVASYKRFFAEYEHHVRGKRVRLDREMPKVYIRIGDSGSGKTRWLDEQFGLDKWARMPNPTSSWWITPTVSLADTVLIDDVGPKKIPKVEEFLEWTDRYPIEFNSKGGFLWWKPKNIVFTSNVIWNEWWPDLSDAHKDAIARRIYRIDLVFKDRDVESFYPNDPSI